MFDADLAELYDVLTKNLNKAVRRNLDRFPDDLLFQLTRQEADSSRFQIGTLKRGHNIKYLPIEDLGRKFDDHDRKIIAIFEAIKSLLSDKQQKSRKRAPLGFQISK